jgi:CHASE2 domain-containing sensor protein
MIPSPDDFTWVVIDALFVTLVALIGLFICNVTRRVFHRPINRMIVVIATVVSFCASYHLLCYLQDLPSYAAELGLLASCILTPIAVSLLLVYLKLPGSDCDDRSASRRG